MATKVASKNGVEQVAIEIPQLDVMSMEITVVGDSGLITNQWSQKAIKLMEDKQQKKAQKGREPKDPQADYEGTIYYMEGGNHKNGKYAFPSIAFKAAAVSACRFQDIKMTISRGAFHINGEFVAIDSKRKPRMRRDMVRVGMGVADIRYRAEYEEWTATFTVRYNAHALSPAQIINLFNVAGFGVGVGEWRPEKDGNHGMFHVLTG